MKPGNREQAPRDPSQWDGLDTYPVAQVEAFVQRIDELEAENKGLAARVAELEARTREAEESNANALARLSAAEATIELRRIENEAVRHQVWHAENVCDAMEKRVFDTDARCKRLEEAGDALERDKQTFKKILADRGVVGSMGFGSTVKWVQAKEAKP